MHKPLIAAAALLALSACAPAAKPTVTAADAWCRAAPAGAMAGACFVTLTASGDDRLVSVSTDAADHVEIHTMSMDGGIMRMRELPDGLALPKGQAVRLSPGHEHLMIIAPKVPMAAGGSLALNLKFAHAPAVSLTAPVRAAPLPKPMGGGMTMSEPMK